MKPLELLSTLASRRVWLKNEGGTLGFSAPDGALDEELQQSLRLHETSLLGALREMKGYVLLCPLSYNQQSLYFMHLLEPTSAAYNLALSMRLRCKVDEEALRRALERLARRHEQLRTTYEHLDLGGHPIPSQFVHEELMPAFETVDVRGLCDADIAARVREFYMRPVDLKSGPMVRAGLFVHAEADSVFLVVTHHIAADMWSMNLILRDLATSYRAETEGTRALPSSSGAEYTDFVIDQRRMLAAPIGMQHLRYWREVLTPPAPPLDLDGAHRRPSMRRSEGAIEYFRLEHAVREKVERLARELEITSFTVLLSVFQWMLMEHSRQMDLVVGIPTLGHKEQRFQETVGYFVNPVPLRCRRVTSMTFREHALATSSELREAVTHRDAPFAAVVEHVGGERDAAHTPVFQVLVNLISRKTLGDVVDLLDPFKASPVDFGGMAAESYALDQQEGQFDLTLEFVDRGGDTLGLLKYCTDLFTREDAVSLAAEYCQRLDSVLADPALTLFTGLKGYDAFAPDAEKLVVAVSATFTAEVFEEFYDFWFRQLGWHACARFAPFNQVFQELLSPSSLLRSNRKGYNLVFLRLEDILNSGDERPVDGAGGFLMRLPAVLDELRQVVERAAQAMAVPLCFILCPSSPEFEEVAQAGHEVLDRFLDALRRVPGVVVLTHEEVVLRYPVDNYHEPLGETLARIPFTRPYQAALTTMVVRSLHALSCKPVKALVVDCDGTLWEGVAAEDGPTGVSIGPWVKRFQEFLLEQYHSGVILCLCSKNRESDVWAVLDQHPGMLIRREHIAFWRINWESKSSNLPSLAAEMNIGLEAVAFLDDNPLERSEVQAGCPSVYCPELPVDWAERVHWFENLWVLDHAQVTGEDRKRQDHFRSERLREDLKRSAGSLNDFLEKLDLRVDLKPADASHIERLAQLSVRTNQFNTTTLRLSPQEVAAYMAAADHSAHVALVSDRFGDYGLVGGMLARATGDLLRVEGMFLSCRSLGRGVEHRMAAYLAVVAIENGCTCVEFPCRTTERNEPARKFLAQLSELCHGALNSDGTLGFDVGRLSESRYQPPEAPAPSPAVREPGAKTALDTTIDRDSAARIAATYRTVDLILAAVDGERRVRRGGAVLSVVTQAPVTATERVIADSWKRALGLEQVDAQVNFFELGGTSLLMAGVAIELRRDHGLIVSVVDLFRYPTISGLARYLDSGGSGGDASNLAIATARRQREAVSGQRLPAAFSRLKKARGK